MKTPSQHAKDIWNNLLEFPAIRPRVNYAEIRDTIAAYIETHFLKPEVPDQNLYDCTKAPVKHEVTVLNYADAYTMETELPPWLDKGNEIKHISWDKSYFTVVLTRVLE